jgi:DNA mismatch repair ATPase MutS
MKVVKGIAELDCLISLSEASRKENYVRPSIVESKNTYVHLEQFRHPIAENFVTNFIPNDITIGSPSDITTHPSPNDTNNSNFSSVDQQNNASIMVITGYLNFIFIFLF